MELMNKFKIIGISALSLFFCLFAYFIAISESDPRMDDGDLTIFEMNILEVLLFSYAMAGSMIGVFYSIGHAYRNGKKWVAVGILMCWPASIIYLIRRVN